MKKIFVFMLAFGFLGLEIINAQPQNSKSPMRNNKTGVFKKLNLTTEQQKQFGDIMYKQKQQSIDIRADIEKNRLEMQKMIKDNNIDEGKILSLTNDNSKLQAEMRSNKVKSWFAVYKILTPEQKGIWAKSFGKMGRAREFMHKRIQQFRGNRAQRPMMRRQQMMNTPKNNN